MSANRVLLMELSKRTSAKGNRYLAGWLGKASVVAFLDEQPDKFGNPVWSVFVSTPESKAEAGQERESDRGPQPRPEAISVPTSAPAAKPSARPVGRGDRWRGQYRRPATSAQRAPAADDGAFHEDDLAALGRR